MSLNSLQDDMSRRAASMAAMAKRASNPQDIQAIQKNLIAGVQNGSIQPYVGIPLIQDLTNKLAEAKAQMAQSMAGAGMQQGPQGVPVAQQVMQQAEQENQGVEALPSNLPQEYAGGGIIAFEGGGEVERFQTGNLVRAPNETFEQYRQRVLQQNAQNKEAQQTQENQAREAERQRLLAERGPIIPPSPFFDRKPLGSSTSYAAPSAINPAGTPFKDPRILGTVPSALNIERDANMALVNAAPVSAAAPAATPGGGIGAGTGFKPPALQTYTPTIATMPERTMGNLTDLSAITKDMPEKTKEAAETAVTKTQTELEGFDKPGFETREGRLGKREATQEKDSAMGRALNLMSLGFGIAGSKERSLAGALGKEGREGIQGLIQGEAASRAARDRLEDYRDNLEQQKVAAKKGNYSAAQAAGKDAANDLRSATQLSLAAAHAGNAQGISLYSTLTQRDIGAAGVANQGQQLQLSAVDQQNRNVLGLAGLDLENKKLAQQGSIAKAQLAAQEKRFDAMDKASQARINSSVAKGLNDFTTGEGATLKMQLAKEYGPNFMTATDARSLEAQRKYSQQRDAYLAIIKGQAIDTISARPSTDY